MIVGEMDDLGAGSAYVIDATEAASMEVDPSLAILFSTGKC